jgi:hypothetical protein
MLVARVILQDEARQHRELWERSGDVGGETSDGEAKL